MRAIFTVLWRTATSEILNDYGKKYICLNNKKISKQIVTEWFSVFIQWIIDPTSTSALNFLTKNGDFNL